jgi:hypothetical protein
VNPLNRPPLIRRTTTSKRGKIRVPRLDIRLLLRQSRNRVVRQTQSIFHDLTRRQRQPLRHRDVGELGRLQHLQEDDIFRPGILNVVAARCGDVSHVARGVVKCLAGRGRGKYGYARTAGEEIVPFVGGRVPVDFAHGARLNGHESGGEMGGDGKGGRVDDLDRTAGDHIGFLL